MTPLKREVFKISEVAHLTGRERTSIRELMDQGVLKAKDQNEGRRKEDGSPYAPRWAISRESVEKFIGKELP
ncbi:MAG: hypothetical protein WC891_08780 [Actinomycetota bacterium]|jgi:hypothetical protein